MQKRKFPSRLHIIFTILVLITFSTSLSAWMVQAQAEDGKSDGMPTAEKGIGLAARFDGQDRLRVIVELKVAEQAKSGELMTPSIHQAQRDVLGEVKSGGVHVIHEYDYIPFMALQVDRAAFEALQKNPNVIGIEEDVLMKPMLQQSVPLIGADDVWLEGVTGAGQVVAILDTGVDKNHPALVGKVVEEACYSTTDAYYGSTSLCPGGVQETTAENSALPYETNCPIGSCDHGTHVAGIVAANNDVIQGVAKDAKLIAIQVFSLVNGSSLGSWSTDQIKGLELVYSLKDEYEIASVNLSLGSLSVYSSICDNLDFNQAYKQAVDNLRAVGIATIAASGNDGISTGISSPACISSVISVGATTKGDLIASYSNSADILDLLAPGTFINSSIPDNRYKVESGTSMATPHVAGAWALLKSFRPGVSVNELLDVLEITGVPIFDNRIQKNFPRIDVLAAKNELSGLKIIPSPSLPIEIQIYWPDIYDDETGYLIERRMDISESWNPLTTTGPNIESYLDSNDLVCEQPYQYQVTPVIGDGFGSPTPFGQTYSLLCAPETVEKLSSTQRRILIIWSDSSDQESNYKVERSLSGDNWENLIDNLPANTTQYEHRNLTCDTSYNYRITAINGSSENVSQEVNLSTNSCDQIAQPQNLIGEALSTSSVKLTWDDVVDDETGYRVERKLYNSEIWEIVTQLGENVVELTDIGLEPYQTYDYRIIATNGSFESLPSKTVSIITNLSQVYLPLVTKDGVSFVDPILNGDFELGRNVAWSEFSSYGFPLVLNQSDLTVVGIIPRSGSWAVWLGGAKNETSRISQNVPISSSGPYLHFWYWVGSQDYCGYDFFNVKINNSIKYQISLCDSNNSTNWVERVIDLSDYSGSSVNLLFEVITDDLYNSNLFLEDVSMSTNAATSSSLLDLKTIILDYSAPRK